MSHDVFVSYSSIDKVVADAVVSSLEKQNARCWYTPRDVQPGADWGKSITKAINEASILVLIFSNNSNNSKRVLDEIYYAIAEGKTIIPFRIENLNPSGAMKLHLSSRHWLDAYDPSWESHIGILVESVLTNLDKPKVAIAQVEEYQSPEPKSKGKQLTVDRNRLIIIVIAAIIIFGLISCGINNVLRKNGSFIPWRADTATPTATITYTPSPTFTPTITPSPTPTATPTPTFTPEITNTQVPAAPVDKKEKYAGIILELQDFPGSYDVVPQAEINTIIGDMQASGFDTIESFGYSFYSGDRITLVIGMTFSYDAMFTTSGYDLGLLEMTSGMLEGAMAEQLAGGQVEAIPLDGPTIGNKSTAQRLSIVAGADQALIDLFLNRVNDIGTMLMIINVGDPYADINIFNLATILTDRLNGIAEKYGADNGCVNEVVGFYQ